MINDLTPTDKDYENADWLLKHAKENLAKVLAIQNTDVVDKENLAFWKKQLKKTLMLTYKYNHVLT